MQQLIVTCMNGVTISHHRRHGKVTISCQFMLNPLVNKVLKRFHHIKNVNIEIAIDMGFIYPLSIILKPHKRLSKQSKRRWFETPVRSLWRRCNVSSKFRATGHDLPPTNNGRTHARLWHDSRQSLGIISWYPVLNMSRDQIHKSNNAPVQYHTMHHSEQKCAHFCSEWCIVGYGQVHYGICEVGLVSATHLMSRQA